MNRTDPYYKIILSTFWVIVTCFTAIYGQKVNPSHHFIENKGQWGKEVLFAADISGGRMYVSSKGVNYTFINQNQHQHPHTSGTVPSSQSEPSFKITGLAMNFVGADPNANVKFGHPIETHYNYYLGNDPQLWAENCKAYTSVTIENLYPHIDLAYYSHGGNIKYDLILKPLADPKVLKFKYEGQDSLWLSGGSLVVDAISNAVIENEPYAYIKDGNTNARSKVACKFTLENDVLSFQLPEDYDRNQTLVIDPELIFSTFSGSVSDNFAYTACFDEEGNLYSGGTVFGPNFPATTGTSFGGGSTDMAILKYDSSGQILRYATFIGGVSGDTPHSMVVNNRNELVIMGTTGSPNYPTSITAYDRSFNRGTQFAIFDLFLFGTDIVVTKLNPFGNLVASTFVGSPGNDGVLKMNQIGSYINELIQNYGDFQRGDVFVDAQDNVYVASSTDSDEFPMVNTAQNVYGGGESDAVVFSLNSNLSNLRLSTYLGGSGDDASYSVKVDNQGAIIVGGGTSSANFPTTTGALRTNFGGATDGFITKLSGNGSSISHSTYLGTNQEDQVFFIDIDSENNVYAAGQTRGAYPVTAGTYRNANSGQFIHKLTPNLSQTVFSTVFGSGTREPNISLTAFLVNECNNIFISGWGGGINNDLSSNNGNTFGMAVTADALFPTTDGSDFYLMAISADAERLLYATFFGSTNNGGDHVDGGTSRFDKKGIMYQAVCSCGGAADNFPTTPDAWSRVNRGINAQGMERCNNAAFKFDLATLSARFETNTIDGSSPSISNGCAPLTIKFTDTSAGGEFNQWNMGDGTTYNNRDSVVHTFASVGSYKVTLRVIDERTCQVEDVVVKTIQVFDDPVSVTPEFTICVGETVQLQTTGGVAFTWFPETGLDDPTSGSPLASPSDTTVYSVRIETPNGCEVTEQVKVNVLPLLVPAFETFSADGNTQGVTQGCAPFTLNFDNRSEGGRDITWDFGDGTTVNNVDNTNHTFEVPGVYEVSLSISDSNRCTDQEEVSKTITVFGADISVSADTTICQGESIALLATGGAIYNWQPSAGLSATDVGNPIATPIATTTYQVEITTINGCVYDSAVRVTVIPTIVEEIEVEKIEKCTEPAVYIFTNNTPGDASYSWNFGDGIVLSDEENPVEHTYREEGLYIVRLETDAACVSPMVLEIDFQPLLIPNAFSPNGDGKNDFFEIITDREVGLSIYDRTGQIIYQNEDYQNDWDGADLPSGNYYYQAAFPQGEICQGWVKLLR